MMNVCRHFLEWAHDGPWFFPTSWEACQKQVCRKREDQEWTAVKHNQDQFGVIAVFSSA